MVALVGNYLNEDEKQELLNNIGKQRQFYELVVAMKEHTDLEFKEELVKVERGLKFDFEQEGTVVSAQVVDLVYNDTVKIHYITRFKNGDVENKKDIFVGRIVEVGNDSTLHKVFSKNENGITVKEIPDVDVKQAAVQDEQFLEEFNFDDNYVPGILLDRVKAENWTTDGCLPGGYIYCGGGCGGYPACESNREGVNRLDTDCCKYHDCCYRYNSSAKGACDAILCYCAQDYMGDYWGALAVVAYFC